MLCELVNQPRADYTGATIDERDTLLGRRYWRREQNYSIVDPKRLAELAEKTITVKEPDLPVYFQTQ